MRVLMLFLNLGFGVVIIFRQTAHKIWAKVTGKPYDSGMDM